MATLAELQDALKNADAAGDADAARQLADAIVSMQPKDAKPVNPAREFGKQFGNPVERGVINALQGPTFGFLDEIMGGIGGVAGLVQGQPFGESYRQTRDVVRGMGEQYDKDFPIGSPVTKGMTAMATGPLFASRAAPGLLPAVGQGARAGATSGALSGLGESEATSLGQAATDTLGGAAMGGAFGGAFPVLGAAAGGAARNVAQRMSPAAAQSGAQSKIAEALLRDAQLPGQVAGQSLARMSKLGPEARVADVGGQNTRQLLDVLATMPGRTKQATETAIRERQAGRAGRLVDAAENSLGTSAGRLTQTIEQLTEARARNAGPLYKALDGATVVVDDDVAALLARAKGLDTEARALFRAQTGQEVPSLATATKGQTLPFSLLDTLKQTLYDAADSAKRAGNRKMGAAWDDVRVQLTEKLDEVSPKMNGQSVYKMARDEFAGKSQLIDAAETGRKAMRGDLMDLRDTMRGLTAGEVDAFRVGAIESLREKVGREAGQTELLKMWKEPNTRDRLQAVFGRNYRQFAAAVAGEARLKPLESVGRGSQTASRLMAAGDLDVSPLTSAAATATAAKTGNIPGMIAGGMNFMRSVQTPEPTRDRMGALLLSRDPNDLRALGPLLQQINQRRAQAAAQLGLLGGQTGQGLIGGLLTQ